MANLAPLMSSAKHTWGTPPDFFAALHREFGFSVDAAANSTNHLLPRWYGPGGEREDALTEPWDAAETYWCNPPYGSQQAAFVAMGYNHMCVGGTSAFLLPARTDTRLFHGLVWNRDMHKPYAGIEVRFIKGRLTFVGADAPAPFPSMVVVMRGGR